MTTIQPTATPTVLQVPAAAAAPTVTMPRPPPSLAQMNAGTALEVLVLAQEAKDGNKLTLRTPAGDVQVQSSLPIDKGARLALEIVRAAPQQLTARIVTVDGQPPPTPAPPTPRPQAAVIADPPPEIAQAPAGTRIEGRVIAREPGPEPKVVVRTPAGDVTVRMPVPVEVGARVALEVERTAPREVSARVVSIDGKPPPPTPAAATVVIPKPPPALAQMPAGTPLEVRVLARDTPVTTAEANAVVRTPAGDVPVKLPMPVDAGAKIALEIVRAGANQVTARIVTVDGKPLMPATEPLAALPPMRPLPQPVVLPIGSAWFAGTPMPLPQLQPLAGFIINQPQPGPPGAPPPVLAAPVGTELAVRVTAFVPPTPVTILPPGAAPIIGAPVVALPDPPVPIPQAGTPVMTPQPGLSTPTPVPGGLPQGPATNPPAMPPAPIATTPASTPAAPIGLELPKPQDATPLSPRPPVTVQPTPPLATVTGTVVAVTPQEAPIVRTPMGDIQIPVRANTPPGSTLTLEVLSMLPPSPDRAAPLPPWSTVAPAALPLATAPGWAALSDAMQLLQRTDPQTAAQLTGAIPDGSPRTAVAVMGFIQALRTGDPRAWPGDATLRGLERAGPRGAQLAAQIAGEVKEMSARAEAPGGEWRSMPLPWNADGKIDRIALITRREGDGDTDEEKKKKGGKGSGTRFLIELDLSRLGELQLDGMFRKGAKSFDMMMRTKAPLPPDMQRDLPGVFAAANAAMGYTGTLSFQVVKKFPDPTKDRTTADRAGIWA